jgi:hypothetical protein
MLGVEQSGRSAILAVGSVVPGDMSEGAKEMRKTRKENRRRNNQIQNKDCEDAKL